MNTCRNCDAPNDTGMLVCEGCFARFTDTGEPAEPADETTGSSKRWGTADEISFVRLLPADSLRKYIAAAELRHRWGGIKASAVMEECRRLLGAVNRI